MRILMLCSSYPRFDSDSASIFLRHLAQALSRSGVKIHVLAPDHAEVDQSLLDPDIQISHFRYFPRSWQTLAYGSGILPNLKQHPVRWIQVPFFLIAMFYALLTVCRKHRPDVIHAHWVIPQGLIATLVGRILNIPVVTTAHGGDVFSLQGSFLAALKKYTLKNSQAWTANTNTTAFTMENLGKLNRPFIIPMGVDITRFNINHSATLSGVTKQQKDQIVLFVGRLVEKKGVVDLIQAFADLPAEQLNITELWIIGDGTEREKLEHKADSLKISHRVRFLGRLANDILPEYYSQADLFVAPSIVDRSGDTEGQGVVIIEAMASGVPVIAYETGGIKDVISNGDTGVLVAPYDITGLTNAITSLLKDKDARQRLAREGRNHVNRHYAWEVVARQFVELFSKL